MFFWGRGDLKDEAENLCLLNVALKYSKFSVRSLLLFQINRDAGGWGNDVGVLTTCIWQYS